jgi:phospholipid-translocating ATPase
MGIIVYCKETNKYMFYLKGADVIMRSKLLESKANFMVEACTDLASEGLRTLVICQKHIT